MYDSRCNIDFADCDKLFLLYSHDRPAPTVPISKLEGQGATSFQCQLLRRKLFKVCRDAICSLKSLTQQLVSDFKSREEFDNQRDYLAFRKLSTLHQFMSEDELNLNDQLSFEEQKDSPPAESLESLKVCFWYALLTCHTHVHTCTCVWYLPLSLSTVKMNYCWYRW